MIGMFALFVRDLGVPSAAFDEAVYLASADALADGARLGTDVFSSQPPLFFLGLDHLGRLVDGDPTAVRACMAVIAAGGCAGAAALAHHTAGFRAALLAIVLVGLAPGFADGAAVVWADTPSVALGLGALGVASAVRGSAGAAIAGALVAAAVLVKLLALPFVAALVVLIADSGPGRWRRLAAAAAGASAVTATVLAAEAGSLGAIYEGAVAFQLHQNTTSAGDLDPVLADRARVAVFALVAILATALAARPGAVVPWARRALVPLALLAGSAGLLVIQEPLHPHHFVLVAAPLAVLAATAAGPLLTSRTGPAIASALVVMAVTAAPGRPLLPENQRDALARAAEAVRSGTSPGSAVLSDRPRVPMLAGRDGIAEAADPATVRVRTGSLDERRLITLSREADAVVIGRAFEHLPGFEAAVRRRFRHRVMVGRMRVYLRRAPRTPGEATTRPGGSS